MIRDPLAKPFGYIPPEGYPDAPLDTADRRRPRRPRGPTRSPSDPGWPDPEGSSQARPGR